MIQNHSFKLFCLYTQTRSVLNGKHTANQLQRPYVNLPLEVKGLNINTTRAQSKYWHDVMYPIHSLHYENEFKMKNTRGNAT